jgi:ATP-dependent DNA helicase RecG
LGRWDKEPVSGYKIEDFDRESFEIFRQEALRHNRMTAKDLELTDLEVMKKLELLTDDGSFTRAAVLTFHRHPERVATGCYTKIGQPNSLMDFATASTASSLNRGFFS